LLEDPLVNLETSVAECADKGVMERFNHGGKMMAVSLRSDVSESLADRIARLVQSRTGGRIHSLRVDIVGAGVVITGRANTYYVKQLATHAALELVSQFSTLTNEIVVS